MRSLSHLLVNQREEKGLSLSQVAYETNISKKYIEALENEDFTVFPAKAYLMGFLKNYSEFLGLDYEKTLSEYNNCLLREEPAPLSELMGVRSKFNFKPWMIYVPIIIVALILGVPPLIRIAENQIEIRKEALRVVEENKNKIFEINTEYNETNVKVGDSYKTLIGSNELLFVVEEITSDVIITEKYKNSEKVLTLKLGSELVLEYQEGSISSTVTLFLKDIDEVSDNSAIMKAKIESKELDILKNIDAYHDSETAAGKESKTILINKHSPNPYSVSIKFEGNILFRYQMKGQELKEFFYQKDSALSMDITRSVQIWTSNAGLTKFKLNGEVLVLGRTGEVHVFTLRWIYVKDKDEYRLEYSTAY